jgi:hypothetical protein
MNAMGSSREATIRRAGLLTAGKVALQSTKSYCMSGTITDNIANAYLVIFHVGLDVPAF